MNRYNNNIMFSIAIDRHLKYFMKLQKKKNIDLKTKKCVLNSKIIFTNVNVFNLFFRCFALLLILIEKWSRIKKNVSYTSTVSTRDFWSTQRLNEITFEHRLLLEKVSSEKTIISIIVKPIDLLLSSESKIPNRHWLHYTLDWNICS